MALERNPLTETYTPKSHLLSDMLVDLVQQVISGNPSQKDLQFAQEVTGFAAKAKYWEFRDLEKLGTIGRHLWMQEAAW